MSKVFFDIDATPPYRTGPAIPCSAPYWHHRTILRSVEYGTENGRSFKSKFSYEKVHICLLVLLSYSSTIAIFATRSFFPLTFGVGEYTVQSACLRRFLAALRSAVARPCIN